MPSTDDNDQVNPVLDSDMKLMLRTFICRASRIKGGTRDRKMEASNIFPILAMVNSHRCF